MMNTLTMHASILLFLPVLSQAMTSLPTTITSLHTTFSSKISDAACMATCLDTIPLADCYTVCQILQTANTTSICQDNTLCSPGCQVACQVDRENREQGEVVRFRYFHRESCQLEWSLGEETKTNVVFLVAGLDRGGVWHTVSSNLTTHTLGLDRRLGSSYPTIAVIAVGSRGVLDILQLNIPSYQDCGDDDDDDDAVVTDDLVIVISLGGVVTILVTILIIILCTDVGKKSSKDRKRNTRHLDKLIENREQVRGSVVKHTKLDKVDTVYEYVLV